MKRVVLFLLPLVVIALAGAVLGYGRMAERAIEKGASRALGVETTLGSAALDLPGNLGLHDLVVRNPEGCRSECLLTLRDGEFVWPLASLFADRVEVELVRLDGVTLNLEKPVRGKPNYDVVLDGVEALSNQGQEEQPSPGVGKVFSVDRVVIRHLEARVIVEAGSQMAVESTVSVPEITFADIGATGLSIEEVTALLVRLVLIAAVQHAEGALPEALRADLEGRLDRL